MQESDTRLAPIERCEISYALNRAPAERTPYPRAGDRVLYRHREWDTEVFEAIIEEVQDPQDRTDPWLWHAVRDMHGRQIFDGPAPRFVAVADPWPWVLLRTWMGGAWQRFITREGRVRGSAGWLPPGWRDRPVRLPGQIIMQPLAPLNTPLPAPRPGARR